MVVRATIGLIGELGTVKDRQSVWHFILLEIAMFIFTYCSVASCRLSHMFHILYISTYWVWLCGSMIVSVTSKSEIVCCSLVIVSLSQRIWQGDRAFKPLHEHLKPVLAVTRTCLHVGHLAECMISSETRNSETVHISQGWFLPCSQAYLGVMLTDTIFLLLAYVRIYHMLPKGTGTSENTPLYVELIGSCFLGGVVKFWRNRWSLLCLSFQTVHFLCRYERAKTAGMQVTGVMTWCWA